jgi:hypothetical protein
MGGVSPNIKLRISGGIKMSDPKEKIEKPSETTVNEQDGELSEKDVEDVAGGTKMMDGCCSNSSCNPSD